MDNAAKKILFVCYGLGIGGIEKCLVNLLNVMQESNYYIDILLMTSEDELKDNLNMERIQFLDPFQYIMSIKDTPIEIKRRGGWINCLEKSFLYVRFRFRIKLGKNAWTVFKRLPDDYDVAVAYSQNDFSPYYVIDKVRAKRKVLWYHNGAYERSGKKYLRDKLYYHQFDYIVAVSTDCAQMLQRKFEFRDDKLLVLKNIPDASTVRKKSTEFVPSTFQTGTFHIVTVGRMTSEKGANLALETCRKLVLEGRNICWHWIGDGNQKETILDLIGSLKLQQHFVLEGNQPNPYPYIHKADIYVQPSYYEAYSTTITEARILGKPIVTTDVGGMRDQLVDGKNGRIVSVDSDAIASAIGELMDNKSLREQFSFQLNKEKFDQDAAFEEYKRTVFR